MIELPVLNYIQNTWSWDMPDCLWASCPKSCCNVKKHTVCKNWKKEEIFHTVMIEESELVLFSNKDVNIETIYSDHGIMHVLNECSIDWKCKLSEFKPLQCKIYPFQLFEARDLTNWSEGLKMFKPLHEGCPANIAIWRNSTTVKNIIMILQELKIPHSYIKLRLDCLSSYVKKPKLKRLLTQ